MRFCWARRRRHPSRRTPHVLSGEHDNAKYTTDLAAVGFKQSSGVNAPVIATYAGAWSATNSHTQLTGTVCGIGVNTTNPRVASAGEGEPACQ